VYALTGEHGTGPEADAARPSTGAVLHDISLTAARQHAQPEAGKFVVPDEMLSLFILCGIDDALGQFRHVCDPVAMLNLLPDSTAFARGSTTEARGRIPRREPAKTNVGGRAARSQLSN